jgi:hypothetical protein
MIGSKCCTSGLAKIRIVCASSKIDPKPVTSGHAAVGSWKRRSVPREEVTALRDVFLTFNRGIT